MGGKKDSSGGLGRALMRQHNQMVQQSKDMGHALLLQQRRAPPLESITDVADIDAIIERATEADLLSSASQTSVILVDDEFSMLPQEDRMRLRKEEEVLHASSLRVPRRPPWNAKMSAEELDVNDRQAFLVWRRNLARLEENKKLIITPFEKNLDIWRQLWRVLERSDLLVMVVDARNPLFYRCPDLEVYAREIDEHKKTLLLVNKADLLPRTVRQRWAEYFQRHNILFLFWSAKAASSIDGEHLNSSSACESDADIKIYERDELLARLQVEAQSIVASRHVSVSSECSTGSSARNSSQKRVVVGFIGYPNVGKSSTINALVGEKRAGVTSTPGKTKHFQTLIISDELMLCDCPGLVFPSFSSSRYDMIASGVLPIDRMTEHRAAVQIVADHVPRQVLESIYNINLPKPKAYEPQSRPPLASEFLRAYCSSRGHVGSSGLPDETRAARQILKDYVDGKIPHFEFPPGKSDSDGCSVQGDESGSSMSGEEEGPISAVGDARSTDIQDLMDDMESFGLASELCLKNAAMTRKKKVFSSQKHHKKPQRSKDRTWRVGNHDGDGMPVVRVHQKPAVNFGGG